MAVEWKRRAGAPDCALALLGHGLGLSVSYEWIARLPAGEPAWNVFVLGQKLEGRSASLEAGKARAERLARQWLSEALATLGPGKE